MISPIYSNIVALAIQALATKEAQDAILDVLEDLIENTDTTIDDQALLPIIRAYRVIADVPDND